MTDFHVNLETSLQMLFCHLMPHVERLSLPLQLSGDISVTTPTGTFTGPINPFDTVIQSSQIEFTFEVATGVGGINIVFNYESASCG